MHKKLLIIALIFIPFALFAQNNEASKYALVIGNSNYARLSKLANPGNDAVDVSTALKSMGFTVDIVLNGQLDQMEEAITRLRNRLSVSKNSYGLFFYAGHGVQSAGDNFLIPVDADIRNESQLRTRTVSVQDMLYELNSAGNELNIMILDACRDNPFAWARGGTRGLTMVSAPAGSIIVYATSANAVADDGSGRNGLFTGELLKHLPAPGLSVQEMLNKTGQAVSIVSGGKQQPEFSIRHFSADSIYLKSPPSVISAKQAITAKGSLEINTISAGSLQIIGGTINTSYEIPAWGQLPVEEISAGSYQLIMRYEDGKTEVKNVEVARDKVTKLDFSYRLPAPKPPKEPKPEKEPKAPKPPAEPKPAKEPKPQKEAVLADSKLNTLGLSIATSTNRPLFVSTIYGTVAPTRFTFFRIGMDFGFIAGVSNLAFSSFYPFAHYSVFLPVNKSIGLHFGLGGGFMIDNYNFTDIKKKYTDPFGVFDMAAGFNLFNMIDVSYNLRVRGAGRVNSKFSLGYLYRFK